VGIEQETMKTFGASRLFSPQTGLTGAKSRHASPEENVESGNAEAHPFVSRQVQVEHRRQVVQPMVVGIQARGKGIGRTEISAARRFG